MSGREGAGILAFDRPRSPRETNAVDRVESADIVISITDKDPKARMRLVATASKNTGAEKQGIIEIEKDIPPPAARYGGRGNFKYPWRSLEINDSFFIANRTIESLYSQVREASRRHQIRLVARASKKDGVEGVRVWRID